MSEFKNFTETDFEKIKDSLKTYLKSQDKLKDYNFEGSALTTLLNILAYNTQYNAYYGNMLASEKFINRAQKRKSITELANNYGYVPYSAKSARAHLSFDVEPVSGYTGKIVIPKNTKFTASVNDITYSFLTTEEYVSTNNKVSNLEVAEGKYFQHKFLVDSVTKFYQIPNKNVDISRLKVLVKQSSSDADNLAEEYFYFDSITEATPESKIYYIQESEESKHEVYFGDNVLGKSPNVGNEIVIQYYTCSGVDANNIREFSLDEEISNVDSIRNLDATTSIGGKNQESIDSIRFTSKQRYKSQNRAVIDTDFYDKLKSIIPDLVDISVWGGEDNIPKQYGKVFYTGIFSDFTTLSVSQDTMVRKELMKSYMVKGITPEFVRPKFSNIKFNISVKRIPNSSDSQQVIESDIKTKVQQFYGNILNKFDAEIYESLFEGFVNSTNKNILASTLDIVLYKNLQDELTTATTNMVEFPVVMQDNSFFSETFTYGVQNYKLVSTNKVVNMVRVDNSAIVSRIGTLTDTTFNITDPVNFYDIVGGKSILVYITPKSRDVVVSRRDILKLAIEDIGVSFNE